MVDTRSNMQLYDLNSEPNVRKFSGMLLTMRSVSASILHLALNITNLFASTVYMNPLTIKCNHMINQTENNEVYTGKNYRSV